MFTNCLKMRIFVATKTNIMETASPHEFIAQLSPTLFWDVDIATINPKKHAPYIVERVLTRGTWDEFKQLIAYYGKIKVKHIAQKLRYLDDRTMYFCSAYFNPPINQFRCYTQKQLNLTHWDY